MPAIIFNADEQTQEISISKDQTVLDGLLSALIEIPYGCKAGACQCCKLQATLGDIPPESQQGLSVAEKKLGYFLSCVCLPSGPLTVSKGTTANKVKAKVLSLDKLSVNVMRIRLSPAVRFLPGQYLTVWHQGTIARSYSIASTPQEGFIECHVKKIDDGVFSTYAFNHLSIGDELEIQGPIGACIYAPNDKTQPILLAGTGTGIAPLFGILKEAIYQQHLGPIHLICAAKEASQFYLKQELQDLVQGHNNIQVTYISQDNGISQEDSRHRLDTPKANSLAELSGDVYQYCKTKYPSTKGYCIYLCGAPSFVTKLKKQCFLAGASFANIYCDAFLPCS